MRRATRWWWLVLAGLCACPSPGDPPDAGAADAGAADAGAADAGAADAGAADAGAADAGQDDAGVPEDAGQPTDGGADAGLTGTGRIEGVVTEALSHRPLAGATVEAGGRTTTTSATGEFVLTQVADGVPLQLRVRGPAGQVHSTTQRQVLAPPTGTLFVTAELLPGCAVTMNLAVDAGLSPFGCGANDARVGLTLPVGGVVDGTGAAVNDVRVELAVLPVALGGRVASDALAAFPGDMQAVSSGGAPVYLESLGAVEVRLSSATSGAPLQLAPGRTAVVTFSGTPAAFDDGSVPAWSFDEAQGKWIEEGATTVVSDPVTGALLHRLEVQHFTFWNADQPATRTCVSGRLVELDGGVLAFAQAQTLGLDYVGQSSAAAAGDGRFSVFARRSSEVELVAAARVGVNFASRRQRVRTNPDATCVDVGDVAIDTAPVRGCVSGRVVDAQGTPVAGIDVVARAHSFTSRAPSGPGGTFCASVPAGERFELLLGGTHQGLPVTAWTRVAAATAGAACGGPGCLTVGDVTLRGYACLAGQVLDGAGPVPFARVLALSETAATVANTNAAGQYCMPVVESTSLEMIATTASKVVQVPEVSAPSTVASCGGAGCGVQDFVLSDAACARGVVTDNGTPVEGVRVDVNPAGGGRARTVFSGAGGAFCAPMIAGRPADLVFSMARPGTRFFATAQVAAATGPGSCAATGCADAGVVALTGTSFSGCVKGRVRDSSRPFRSRVDVLNGNRVALLRPREDGAFCVEVPVATTLTLVDPDQRPGCVGLRTMPVDVSGLQAGSCADEATCLEAGELDFAAFCASS